MPEFRSSHVNRDGAAPENYRRYLVLHKHPGMDSQLSIQHHGLAPPNVLR